MPTTKAGQKAVTKYMKANYDEIKIRVKKGKKDEIKAHAEAYQPQIGKFGKVGYSPAGSLQGFINRAIDETVERDTSTTPIAENDKPQAPKSSKEFEVAQINLTDEEVAHIKKRRHVLSGTDTK